MPDRAHPHLGIIALNSAVPRLLNLVDDGGTRGPAVGGIEVQVLAIARALAARQWEVTVLVGDWGQIDDYSEVEGLKVLRAFHKGSSPLAKVGAGVRLWQRLRTLPVDVWLLQGVHAAAGLATVAAHCSGKRFVFWLASDTDACCRDRQQSRLPRSQRRLAAYGLKHADALVAQTHHQQDLLQQHFGRTSTVIPNVWQVDSIGRGQAAIPTALWVANLRWEKRPEMLLEIAAAVPEMRFIMVGGPMRGNEHLYQQLVERQKDLPNLNYVGPVPFAQVGSYFEQASFFINTSTVEGFPNTFLQAWDAGLPIIASFDPDGVLQREGLGCFCQSVEDFAASLQRLAHDEPERQALGERGKQYLRDNFSIERVIPRLEKLLEQVEGARRD